MIVLFSHLTLLSQTSAPFPNTFQHIGAAQGLSQSTILSTLQDSYGFMWFGTQDGLNRYDGYSFRTYRSRLGDTSALAGNSVFGLYQGHSGRLWVLTNNGLCSYNRARETFFTVQVPTGRFSAMLEDTSGHLWIAAQNGVFRYTIAQNRIESCFQGQAYCIGEDSLHTIWIGTEQGLFSCASSSASPPTLRKHTHFPHQPVLALTVRHDTVWAGGVSGVWGVLRDTAMQFHPEHSLPPALQAGARVFALRFDSHENLWVRYTTGLVRYSMKTQQRQTMKNPSEAAFFITSNVVTALSEDSDGRMWIGTTNGLFIYAEDRISAIPVQASNNSGLREYQIRSLYADRTGTMWIGFNVEGVQSWHKTRQKFQVVRSDPMNPQSLSSRSVRAFANGSTPDEYWIATDNGLNLWNRRANTWKIYRAGKADAGKADAVPGSVPRSASRRSELPSSSASLPTSAIRALYRAPNGVLWLGAYGAGLCSFIPETERFTTYSFHPSDTLGISSEQVRSIFPDTASNRLFLGHYTSDIGTPPFNGGITVWRTSLTKTSRLNAPNQALRHYLYLSTSANTRASLSNNEVRTFHRDALGRLWIGTHGGGLNLLNEKNGTFQYYLSNSKDTNSLSGNTITSICDADNGKLWVTTTFGLNYFDPERGTAQRFSTRDGLPNDYIYGMLRDKHGNLWLSTNQGLSKFSPETKTFRNYDVHDGLQSNEFNSGAYFLNANGEMMFGGVDGFNIFSPDSIPDYSVQTSMRLTEFLVLNQPLHREKPLQEYSEFHLPYHQNFIELEFSPLEYSNPGKMCFAYKLVGVDKDWVFSGSRRFASYSELEAGSYDFFAQASAEDGTFSLGSSPMLVRIIIHPPFWKTWWFRALVAMLVVSAAWAFYLSRIRRMQRQKQELERLVQKRTIELEAANEELQQASDEIVRQNDILQEQTVQVELSNSEIAEANAQLEDMNTRLQTLNQRKNELVGMVAHDLRNPLTSIIMSAELITRAFQKLSVEKVIETVGKVKISAERMNTIIGDVLNIEAVEAGTLQFRQERVNLSALAKAICEEYSSIAAQKNIRLHFSSTNPDIILLSDERATHQIIENLISNAIKYSPLNTNIWITIEALSVDNRLYGRCSVRDEGPGLSSEDHSKLFGRFMRLTPRPTGNETSTGLGLSIVKEFTEAMGGRISCKSSLGQGSEFIVELPQAQE
jgi:signal transduction histidine kinase/ligand-binding sensor domain-containing protein